MLSNISKPTKDKKAQKVKIHIHLYANRNHHYYQYSPYPGVPPKRKVAEVHHGFVTGYTWTLSRLHTGAVSGLIPPPFTLCALRSSYLSTDTAPQYPQAPAQYVVFHTEVHCCDAPIQTCLPVKNPL